MEKLLIEKLKVKPIATKKTKLSISLKPSLDISSELLYTPDAKDDTEITIDEKEKDVEKKEKKDDEKLEVTIPKLGKPPIDPLNINIIDKTKELVIDRKEILKKLKQEKPIKDAKSKETDDILLKKKIVEPIKIEPIMIFKSKLPKKIILTAKLEKELPVFPKTISSVSKPARTSKSDKLITKDKKEIIIGPIELNPEIIEVLPPEKSNIILKAPTYFMNNRQLFIAKIEKLFNPYKKELDNQLKTYNCDTTGNSDFNLLVHQKLVRDYINLITPYRGILLYHGLGSGKTCSSIAIAEGLKSEKKIYVLLPASLKRNYTEELKKCGDLLYRKNQYWQFLNISEKPELLESLSSILQISLESIKKNNGAWFINYKIKEPNYDKLSSADKESLDKQLDLMIENKYIFIHYNGINAKRYNEITKNETINPFDNNVVIIDEAHNFISMIVNKLKNDTRSKEPTHVNTKLYNLLLKAENNKIILLTGTPIINYPNEIGVMMNILRGNIKVWNFKLIIKDSTKIDEQTIQKYLKNGLESKFIFDLIQYDSRSNILKITRNPFYFNTDFGSDDIYNGVSKIAPYINDNDFKELIIKELKKYKIEIDKSSIQLQLFDCLPDTLDNFISEFLEIDPSSKKPNKTKNMEKFKKRIIGLTSYFPDIDKLLPQYNKDVDFIIENIEMSDPQFKIYEAARVKERKLESQNSKKKKKVAGSELFEDSVSTYRIFSRQFCNFVFPEPDIKRPLPNSSLELKNTFDESEEYFDPLTEKQELEEIIDEIQDKKQSTKLTKKLYPEELKKSIDLLYENKEKYLTPESLKILSPKFLTMFNNIISESNIGLHLMYSQFKTGEGINIFSLILKANGFAEFKIKKDGIWKLDMNSEDLSKPYRFVMYTGSEGPEEKEIYRNIFNGDWENIPPNLREELQKISKNNLYGEIIKLIMITASGAEGISLKNVRFVHITEPYWHNVRLQQIIGRARRICSHKNLPPELQTVQVYLYLMKFSEKQLSLDDALELKAKDKSKLNVGQYLTSDEALYELANIKEKINIEILKNIKEASIDCNIHESLNKKEGLTCLKFSTTDPNKFSYYPSISQDESDVMSQANMQTQKINAKAINLAGTKYGKVAWDQNRTNGNIYNLEDYMKGIITNIGIINITVDKETGKQTIKVKDL
jgi:hypothetical protein